MKTAFQEDDRVHSTVTAQGLQEGHLYEVANVNALHAPWGSVVTYYLREVNEYGEPDGPMIPVVNGHLLLTLAVCEPEDDSDCSPAGPIC